MRGITGPPEVFEGNKGFMQAIAGLFSIDWRQEDLERVNKTIIKKYNAQIHSQSAIEGILELTAKSGFKAEDVERVEVEIFDVAYHIIGGGDEGDKTVVRTKEEADHSLPYLLSAAILDGRVMPEQFNPERIRRENIQKLIPKMAVIPTKPYSERFPSALPCLLRVSLKHGRVLTREKKDSQGFHTRPASWESAVGKFAELCEPYTDSSVRQGIIDVVRDLERADVHDLTSLLRGIQ